MLFCRKQRLDLGGAAAARVHAEKDSAAALNLRAPLIGVCFGHAGLHQRRFQIARHLAGDVPGDFAELGRQRARGNDRARSGQADRDRRENVAAQFSQSRRRRRILDFRARARVDLIGNALFVLVIASHDRQVGAIDAQRMRAARGGCGRGDIAEKSAISNGCDIASVNL